jgi:hypothetical protein
MFYEMMHVFDEMMHTFEGLRTGGDALLLSESVQPLDESLDVILSKRFLYEFLCCAFSYSYSTTSQGKDGLIRPCLTCFVARARTEITSANFSTTMTVMAVVRGIFV